MNTINTNLTVEPEKVDQPIDPMRFQAACAAMQGILANGEFLKFHKDENIEQIAIKCADALISALKGGDK
jgi:hypothetical protein